jgi:hypothetical protein
MKLYTEEQMRVVYNLGFSDSNNNFGRKEDETINFFTPIELPSDEEIEQRVTTLFGDVGMYQLYDKDRFIDGAKWLKEQILNQNK